MYQHKISVSLRKGIFHTLASIHYVMKLHEHLIKKKTKLMERLEKSNKSMFTDIIQNTSSPLCLDLQFKCLLDGKQKPQFLCIPYTLQKARYNPQCSQH